MQVTCPWLIRQRLRGWEDTHKLPRSGETVQLVKVCESGNSSLMSQALDNYAFTNDVQGLPLHPV